MDSSDPFRRLPNELLGTLLDNLVLNDLVRIMRTCLRFRNVVVQHRTYWRTHHIKSNDKAAVLFFVYRMDRSIGKLRRVWVDLPDIVLNNAVLHVIRRHLTDITHLRLVVHNAFDAVTLMSLYKPAPALLHFELERTHSRALGPREAYTPLPLPLEIFANAVNNLRQLSLVNVRLPSHLPSSFRNVDRLTFGFRTDNELERVNMRSIAHHFPRLSMLTLLGNFCWVDPGETWPASWSTMSYLEFQIDSSTFLQVLPVLSISKNINVATMDGDWTAFRCFISHLHGALELGIERQSSDHVITHLTSIITRRVRSMHCAHASWNAERPYHDIFSSRDVCDRVVRLVIPVTCLELTASYLCPLPLLQEFTLLVEDGYPPLASVDASFSAPQLRVLRVRSSNGTIYIRPQELVLFSAKAFRDARLPLDLELNNVLFDPWNPGNRSPNVLILQQPRFVHTATFPYVFSAAVSFLMLHRYSFHAVYSISD